MTDVEELNDIWNSISNGVETVTEQQSERGNQRDISDFDGRIRDTIIEMSERYNIQTKLSNDQLVTVVRRYFDGETDAEIARQLGEKNLDKTVSRARVRLHLFRERDFDTEVNLDELMNCLTEGNSASDCGDEFGIAKSTANRYRRLIKFRREAKRIDNEYWERFQRYCNEDDEEALVMSSLDGLKDAVADAGADNPSL